MPPLPSQLFVFKSHSEWNENWHNLDPGCRREGGSFLWHSSDVHFEASSSGKKFYAFRFSEGPPRGQEQSINWVLMKSKYTLDVCSATAYRKSRMVKCNNARLKKQWMCEKKKKSKRTNFPKKLAGLLK